MGQTLTHGIYLPDEGERNCYNGLAANWQLLDGAVGTVAEHTTQIAGKAPAVHTHTKADITDLFNSANTWSASQTFTDTYIKNTDVTWGIEPSSAKHRNLYFTDSSDIAIGYVRRRVANGSQGIYVAGRAPVKNGQLDPTGDLITWGFSQIFLSDGSTYFQFDGNIGNSIIPKSNNSYDLGSSSYQWNNLYAKNYYYNGTAWGLDKANTWSQINNFKTLRLYGVVSNNLVMYPPSGEKGDSSTFGFNIICSDKNLGNYAASGVANIGMGQSGGMSYVAMNASTKGSIDNNIHSIQIGLQITASDNANIGSFYPTQNGGINLGTSTNKWKTLNGINPGALSLPSANYIDISSSITDRNYGANYYTAPSNGYVCIGSMASSLQISNDTLGFGISGGTAQDGYSSVYIPVRTGDTVRILLNQTSTDYQTFRFYPCQGNV